MASTLFYRPFGTTYLKKLYVSKSKKNNVFVDIKKKHAMFTYLFPPKNNATPLQ